MGADLRGKVVVVTGASGGVGRATVRLLAERGAVVALLARGEAGLDAAVNEIGTGRAYPVDVAAQSRVQEVAEQIERDLGPIEVWINVAFSSVFARFWDTDPAEYERATQVSYLGYVWATRAALSVMRERDRGVIVQCGSALTYRAIPLQAAYCGAKHAVKGFTESLRTELMAEGSNVKVTMVQLPAVNTPQFDWVLSRLRRHPQPVAPIYQPEVAARALVYAAEHPNRREYWVGASTVLTILGQKAIPGLLDRYLARTGIDAQQGDGPANTAANLWKPADQHVDHGAHGGFDERSHPRSVQQWFSHHPALAAAGVAVGAAATTVALRNRR